MKFTEVIKDRKYFKIFLRFPINSILSFIIRFSSLFFLVDLLNYDYTLVYLISYLYIICQSYLIQKFIVQKSRKGSFTKFLYSNIIIGIFEYSLIYFLQMLFNTSYVYMFLIAALIVYFLRFYIYTFKIFN